VVVPVGRGHGLAGSSRRAQLSREPDSDPAVGVAVHNAEESTYAQPASAGTAEAALT